MEQLLASWLPVEGLQRLLSAPYGELWLAVAVMGMTAAVYASGIPGALLPISFSSGALLGGTMGTAAVTGGAMLGAFLLYRLLERASHATLRKKYGHRMRRFEELASRGGVLPIVCLRLAGLPHLAVTALCALAAVGPRRYAIATFVGILPAITLSAIAGSFL